MKTKLHAVCLLILAPILCAGCGKKPTFTSSVNVEVNKDTGVTTVKKGEYIFGIVAKSQSNPVFQSARIGAEDAARDLSAKLGVKVTALWRTPNEQDAQKQVEFIEQMALQGVDGVSVSCIEADTLTPAIDKAVDGGMAVMCFDSDAPKSKRFCYFGTDDLACGRTIMSELAKVLGPGPHTVAIPGGNQNAQNLQNRIKGAQDEAKKYPDIKVQGVYYSKETPQDAAAEVEQVQNANPNIDGWAMIGAWALFTDALMKWEPGKVKIVAMDALPAELPYLRKGVVQKLYAQQTYEWGYKSVEMLAEKAIHGKNPPDAMVYAPLVEVNKDNVDEFEKNWQKWLR